MKHSEGKYEPTLVYTSLIKHVARVRRYGIEKHGNSEDWRTTTQVQHYDAALRHLLAVIDGEEFDESGMPHLAHCITTLMFELERNYGGEHANFIRSKSSSDH